MGESIIDYIKYKEQLLIELEIVQQEIAFLETEGDELNRQLKAQCEQIQEIIAIAKAQAEFLKARNKAKRKVLDCGNKTIQYYTEKNVEVDFKSQKKAKSKPKRDRKWNIAYEYSCSHPDTPDLQEKSLNEWVKTVTKNCAEKIRNLNHHILEGNIAEIEKITGFTTVESVANYVKQLVNEIEELAEVFGLIGEITSVYSAFDMIIEDFRTTGFYRKTRSKSYWNSTYGKQKNYPHEKELSRRDFPTFKNCNSIKEAKELKKKLSMENHPDLGGSEDEMKRINHQFDLFIQWIEKYTASP